MNNKTENLIIWLDWKISVCERKIDRKGNFNWLSAKIEAYQEVIKKLENLK